MWRGQTRFHRGRARPDRRATCIGGEGQRRPGRGQDAQGQRPQLGRPRAARPGGHAAAGLVEDQRDAQGVRSVARDLKETRVLAGEMHGQRGDTGDRCQSADEGVPGRIHRPAVSGLFAWPPHRPGRPPQPCPQPEVSAALRRVSAVSRRASVVPEKSTGKRWGSTSGTRQRRLFVRMRTLPRQLHPQMPDGQPRPRRRRDGSPPAEGHPPRDRPKMVGPGSNVRRDLQLAQRGRKDRNARQAVAPGPVEVETAELWLPVNVSTARITLRRKIDWPGWAYVKST